MSTASSATSPVPALADTSSLLVELQVHRGNEASVEAQLYRVPVAQLDARERALWEAIPADACWALFSPDAQRQARPFLPLCVWALVRSRSLVARWGLNEVAKSAYQDDASYSPVKLPWADFPAARLCAAISPTSLEVVVPRLTLLIVDTGSLSVSRARDKQLEDELNTLGCSSVGTCSAPVPSTAAETNDQSIEVASTRALPPRFIGDDTHLQLRIPGYTPGNSPLALFMSRWVVAQAHGWTLREETIKGATIFQVVPPRGSWCRHVTSVWNHIMLAPGVAFSVPNWFWSDQELLHSQPTTTK